MASHSPDFIVLGQLRREFILTAAGKIYLDRPGGSLLYASGGVSFWLQKKEKVGLVGRVGEDFPREWLSHLGELGFDTTGIRVLSEPMDLRWFVAYDEAHQPIRSDPVAQFMKRDMSFPRALIGLQDNQTQWDATELSQHVRGVDLPEEYHYAEAAHVCPMSYLSHSLLPAELRRVGTKLVTLDPGESYMNAEGWATLPALLPGLSAFLPSLDALRNLFRGRTENIWEMVEEIAGYGCEVIVVKAGAQGQYLYDGLNHRRYEVPAYPSRITDLTGAGDVFSGGFLAGLLRFGDPLEALFCGSAAASVAIEGSGPFFASGVLSGLQEARIETLRQMSYKI